MKPTPLLDGLALAGLLPLPIRVDRMSSRADFLDVAALRRAAYTPRYPSFVQPDEPDAWDAAPSAVVLIARDLASGAALGTLRTRHSLRGREAGVFDAQAFPDWLFERGSFVTVERFAVRDDLDAMTRRLVRFSLFTAVHATGLEIGAAYVNGYTITALERVYRSLGMTEPRPFTLSACDALTNWVPQRLLEAPTRELPIRSQIPFTRYLMWRLRLGLDRRALVAENLGGPKAQLGRG